MIGIQWSLHTLYYPQSLRKVEKTDTLLYNHLSKLTHKLTQRLGLLSIGLLRILFIPRDPIGYCPLNIYFGKSSCLEEILAQRQALLNIICQIYYKSENKYNIPLTCSCFLLTPSHIIDDNLSNKLVLIKIWIPNHCRKTWRNFQCYWWHSSSFLFSRIRSEFISFKLRYPWMKTPLHESHR